MITITLCCMDYEHRNPVKVRTSVLCIFFIYLRYIVKDCEIYLILYKKIIISYFILLIEVILYLPHLMMGNIKSNCFHGYILEIIASIDYKQFN